MQVAAVLRSMLSYRLEDRHTKFRGQAYNVDGQNCDSVSQLQATQSVSLTVDALGVLT